VKEWTVATVGSVVAALQGLDSSLPLGALRVERHGEVTDFDVGDVVEVHVEQHRTTGEPLAAWVVTGLLTGRDASELGSAVPSTWTLTRAGCGCVIPVRVRPGQRVVTLSVRCPHYEPGPVGRRLAALTAGG
jgi:hypothetical protein